MIEVLYIFIVLVWLSFGVVAYGYAKPAMNYMYPDDPYDHHDACRFIVCGFISLLAVTRALHIEYEGEDIFRHGFKL